MTVIARDAVASDHLVYAWPFPIGPECEITCSDDEQVVMCPAWLVGDRLGPGRHHWRTPDPTRPVGAFFVLTAPVEVSFDMTTGFMIPTTGQPVRLRAVGSLQVRCADPGLLIAQFVGLPFDSVNEGILRSVSRSVERMLARLLTRRVVMSGTPLAVTDPQMLAQIVEELVAYNPTAGAVFGVELIRVGHLTIAADDGQSPYLALPMQHDGWGPGSQPGRVPPPHANGEGETIRQHAQNLGVQIPQVPRAAPRPAPDIPLLETVRGHARAPGMADATTIPPPLANMTPRAGTAPGDLMPTHEPKVGNQLAAASGEIIARPKKSSEPPPTPPRHVEVPKTEDITQPGVHSPAPPAMRAAGGTPTKVGGDGKSEESRGSILGIGMSHVGMGSVSGEIPAKVPPGSRVLVPGPNGLMQSATVRQLLQGYYELEVGSSGETIWVPINGVVPEH